MYIGSTKKNPKRVKRGGSKKYIEESTKNR